MRIRVIDPVTPSLLPADTVEGLRRAAGHGVELSCVGVDDGPRSIETTADEERATPGTLRRVLESQRLGHDAAVIACVGDVAVAAARGVATIPVIGPGEAAMQLAASWGARFSILVATPDGVDGMRDLCKRYGFEAHLASVRGVGIPIVQLGDDLDRTVAAFSGQAVPAVREDGADTIIIGCTVAAPARDRLAAAMASAGLAAPVIEPLSWAVVLAHTVARYRDAARGTAE